jgi:4-oxalocrotonate tautomerase
MPYVNLKMYPGRTEEQKREVARRIAEVVGEVCNVPDLAQTVVVIEDVPREEWAAKVVPEYEARPSQTYNP